MSVTILCIGKATQDVFLQSDEFDPHREGKVAYTHLPLGAKLDIDEVTFSTGGNATNVAVTFARQGLHSRYMWALGNDMASTQILNDLDNESVDTTHVVQDDRFRAGYSAVMIAESGERTILNYKGKSVDKHGHPLDLSAIKDADWVYPTSLADGGLDLLTEIVDTAKEHGVKVMLNPAGPELAKPAKLKSLLEDVDVLCLNKEEMQALVEGDSLEELVRHGLHYVPVVIVSDGPNGVAASDGKTFVSAGMYEDVPVIDRTGAGDGFASGFLSQWAVGKSLEESIIFGSANSTSIVRQIGAKPGILHHGALLHDMPMKVKQLQTEGIPQ
jgi:ribokinase